MRRREVSMELDEELVAAARAEAERQGTSENEVVELALRKYLVPLEVLDRVGPGPRRGTSIPTRR